MPAAAPAILGEIMISAISAVPPSGATLISAPRPAAVPLARSTYLRTGALR